MSLSLNYIIIFNCSKVSYIVFVSLVFVNTEMMTLFRHRNTTTFVY